MASLESQLIPFRIEEENIEQESSLASSFEDYEEISKIHQLKKYKYYRLNLYDINVNKRQSFSHFEKRLLRNLNYIGFKQKQNVYSIINIKNKNIFFSITKEEILEKFDIDGKIKLKILEEKILIFPIYINDKIICIQIQYKGEIKVEENYTESTLIFYNLIEDKYLIINCSYSIERESDLFYDNLVDFGYHTICNMKLHKNYLYYNTKYNYEDLTNLVIVNLDNFEKKELKYNFTMTRSLGLNFMYYQIQSNFTVINDNYFLQIIPWLDHEDPEDCYFILFLKFNDEDKIYILVTHKFHDNFINRTNYVYIRNEWNLDHDEIEFLCKNYLYEDRYIYSHLNGKNLKIRKYIKHENNFYNNEGNKYINFTKVKDGEKIKIIFEEFEIKKLNKIDYLLYDINSIRKIVKKRDVLYFPLLELCQKCEKSILYKKEYDKKYFLTEFEDEKIEVSLGKELHDKKFYKLDIYLGNWSVKTCNNFSFESKKLVFCMILIRDKFYKKTGLYIPNELLHLILEYTHGFIQVNVN